MTIMKKYNSILKYIFITAAALFVTTGCVHDDKYEEPNLDGYQCVADFQANTTLSQLKKKFTENNPAGEAYVFPEDKTPNDSSDDLYIQGYVSSTDETGNIYKTIYIQDALENPTHGFTISVDMVSSYTKFPQGTKIYVKLNGLAVGTYGNVVQLGVKTGAESFVNAVSRIPEKKVPQVIFRSCTTRGEIKPKLITLAEMKNNEDLIGCLVQLDNVEFDSRTLCSNYAPNGQTVDRGIGQGWNAQTKKYLATAVVRNSGYASFANQTLPAGKGTLKGIFSKFNSTYQMYINKVSDVDLEGDKNGNGKDEEHFPRLDGIEENPCKFSSANLTAKTVADVEQLAGSLAPGSLVQITGDYYLKAQVVANDETGNLFKYVYVEDATGGIKVNINKADLFLDNRFKLGKDLNIKLKGLYIRNVNGELQLGSNDSSSAVGYRIKEEDIYQYLFDSNAPARPVVATEKTISQLTAADVGRWIKIKDLQFINGDLGKTYADGTSTSNRTLEDCSGNKITLRTSGRAVFGLKTASSIEVAGGKGDIYAVLSVYNDTYQLWITQLTDVKMTNPRCDGSIYTPIPVLYSDDFAAGGFSTDWTLVNKAGPSQFWVTSNQGNGSNYYAMMNGYASGNNVNEDWLISKAVSLVGKTKAAVSFTTDVRYNGNALQVYATDNYTGDVTTTNWTQLPATLDTNTGGFGDWVSSGNVDLSAFLGKNVRIAFKYTSTSSAAATWEVDDFKIKGQ